MVFKRFNPRTAYPVLYVGIGLLLTFAAIVLASAIWGLGNTGEKSKLLLGSMLIGVFGFAFFIGIKYKETVYPKINYVDFYENKGEFIFAMIAHSVFVIFGMYVVSRVEFPTIIPKII